MFYSTVTPPARSTLFPYTTLFRSRRDRVALLAFRGNGAELVLPPVTGMRAARRDRKSIRLKSRPLGIAYGGFCLQKKRHDQRRGLRDSRYSRQYSHA